MQEQIKRPLRVLYIVYWGANESLGQSLVLPAITRLAMLGVRLTLVTFEKPEDLSNQTEMMKIRVLLEQHGVHWIPLRYHKRPKLPATAFDLLQGCAYSIAARLRARPDIIHARTYISGLIGLALAPLLRVKLVYHNEGFYPDEQVDAGVWKENSTPHRIAKFLERMMYEQADGIIALSHQSKREIEALPNIKRKAIPVIVVPSCVDLERFQWQPSPPPSEKKMGLVYVGNVEGRYMFKAVARFAGIAYGETAGVSLRVLTRATPSLVASIIRAGKLPEEAWSVASVPHATIPMELAQQQAGLHFLPRGLSEHSGSPTKVGEYWACGLPVVITPNAGDTEQIIRRERVGVVISEHSDEAYRHAVGELQSLLKDPDLPQRCRHAAETHYALDPACARQVALYRKVLGAPTSNSLPAPQ
ncbi:MAG: glycosyltransferase [Pyrinomonadaceae bacterium]